MESGGFTSKRREVREKGKEEERKREGMVVEGREKEGKGEENGKVG